MSELAFCNMNHAPAVQRQVQIAHGTAPPHSSGLDAGPDQFTGSVLTAAGKNAVPFYTLKISLGVGCSPMAGPLLLGRQMQHLHWTVFLDCRTPCSLLACLLARWPGSQYMPVKLFTSNKIATYI